MDLFTDLDARVAALRGLLPGTMAASGLGAALAGLSDDEVLRLAEHAAQARRLLEQVTLATSAAINARSTRDLGHAGLAQSRGFRTPGALVQQVTGVSRGVAMQQIRVGEALLEAETAGARVSFDGAAVSADGDGAAGCARPPGLPWHAPLGEALVEGMLSPAQHDAIARGLGEPAAGAGIQGVADEGSASEQPPSSAAIEAWSLAAERLVSLAAEVPVEELAKQARQVRDLLDPAGGRARFMARYEARSFRFWTDQDGLTHGRFVFDDESAEWVRTIIDTALRPRRGGPRFVSGDEQTQADRLTRDPRSNEQLAHDLLIDVLRAGSVADAETVFGARLAGIKLVQVVNRDEYLAEQRTAQTARAGHGSALREDSARPTRFQESGTVIPMSLGERQRCNTGVQTVITDEVGNPLDVGREQRLFTSRQRVALAIRDGGCRWPGCERPASYCEAHHVDHWEADHGRTDVDRGVLLCRFHHLQLHNNGWSITRDGLGPFLLHAPIKTHEEPGTTASGRTLPGEELLARGNRTASPNAPPNTSSSPPPNELRAPLPLTYTWQLAARPEKRIRAAA
ncbi:MAG: DUF222 domain-containing protein [Actinobacteria bacterium]|nr:DUF222 domain-containing protein [Actinomycetota bacterium]